MAHVESPASRAGAAVLAAVLAMLLPACGGESEREVIERTLRERRDLTAGAVRDVRCEPAELAWGCELRLEDGRTQACQAAVRDERVTSVSCQPLRAE